MGQAELIMYAFNWLHLVSPLNITDYARSPRLGMQPRPSTLYNRAGSLCSLGIFTQLKPNHVRQRVNLD